MSVDVGRLGWPAGSSDTILKGDQLKTIPFKFGPNRLSIFREDFKNIFPIRSYVKIMLVDVGRLGWLAGSSDTILKGGPLRDHSIKVWSH